MGVINSVRIEFQRPHGNSDDAVVSNTNNDRSRNGTYIPLRNLVVRRPSFCVGVLCRRRRRRSLDVCKEKRLVIVFTFGGVSFLPCVFFIVCMCKQLQTKNCHLFVRFLCTACRARSVARRHRYRDAPRHRYRDIHTLGRRRLRRRGSRRGRLDDED